MDTPEFTGKVMSPSPEIEENLLLAGREYYNSLIKLGFKPEGLLWAYDELEEKFRLWLIWSGLDRFGPLAISKLLFKAYNASALPKEIDPFTVYVVTPAHSVGRMSSELASFRLKQPNLPGPLKFRSVAKYEDRKQMDDQPLHTTDTRWVYHMEPARFSEKQINREWRKFNANVNALAA